MSGAWTKAVIWRKEHPELYESISAEDQAMKGFSSWGRIYHHGSLGNDEIDRRYMDGLAQEIPFFAGTSYGEVLRDDLKLMRQAIARDDRCIQMVDRSPKGFGAEA